MKNFYIFRHGETDMNKQGFVQGQKHNSVLNETGILQAKAVVPNLINKNIEVIYASTLNRALETGNIVGNALKIPVFPEPSFIECCFGDIEGMEKDEASALFKSTYQNWHNENARFPNGESRIEIVGRVLGKMNKIINETAYKNIGIATHGGVIRALSLHFDFDLGFIPNGAIFHIIYDGKYIVKGVI